MAYPDESVSTRVGNDGSKCRRRGVLVKAFFMLLKALRADAKAGPKGRLAAAFVVSLLRGNAMEA